MKNCSFNNLERYFVYCTVLTMMIQFRCSKKQFDTFFGSYLPHWKILRELSCLFHCLFSTSLSMSQPFLTYFGALRLIRYMIQNISINLLNCNFEPNQCSDHKAIIILCQKVFLAFLDKKYINLHLQLLILKTCLYNFQVHTKISSTDFVIQTKKKK